MSGYLRKFSVFELILLALIGACGIAAKWVIVPIVHLITGPLLIPGGAVAGGFYMAFVVIGGAIVGKPGAATLVCIVQCIVVMVGGAYGSHGAASIITYVLPGVLVDLIWLLMSVKEHNLISCFIGSIVANVSGSVLVNFIFFRLPLIPLLLSIALASFSGGLGGVVAWKITKRVKKLKVF